MASGNGNTWSFVRVPVLGQVFAGKPVPIEALPIIDWREIRPIKGTKLSDRFACAPVAGDSMVEDHIIDGDFVIFKLTNQAQAGNLVIALTPDGLTLKYLFPQPDGKILLKGANALRDDQIWEARHVKVQGIVKRMERDF